MYIMNEKTDRSFCDKVSNLYAKVRMKNEKKKHLSVRFSFFFFFYIILVGIFKANFKAIYEY